MLWITDVIKMSCSERMQKLWFCKNNTTILTQSIWIFKSLIITKKLSNTNTFKLKYKTKAINRNKHFTPAKFNWHLTTKWTKMYLANVGKFLYTIYKVVIHIQPFNQMKWSIFDILSQYGPYSSNEIFLMHSLYMEWYLRDFRSHYQLERDTEFKLETDNRLKTCTI